MCREKYVVVKHLLTQKKEGKNAESENFVNTMGLCYQTRVCVILSGPPQFVEDNLDLLMASMAFWN